MGLSDIALRNGLPLAALIIKQFEKSFIYVGEVAGNSIPHREENSFSLKKIRPASPKRVRRIKHT